MTNKGTVSIVGGGAVGKAIAAYYPGAKIYDKYQPARPIEEVAAADFIFVAVPTPFDEAKQEPDLAEMDDALATLAKNLTRPAEQIVIIKSTVVPGTTYAYQEKFPALNLIFNPEFLTERVAAEDFAHPDKQLVGVTGKTGEFGEKVMKILPRAPYEKIMHARAAEMAKYAINSFYAFKVVFGNSFYDLCQKVGANYDQVREGLVHDKRIIDSHFDVFHGNFRGYGGKCLPKDVKTLAWLARSKNKPAKFIETIIALNEKLIAKKSLTNG